MPEQNLPLGYPLNSNLNQLLVLANMESYNARRSEKIALGIRKTR